MATTIKDSKHLNMEAYSIENDKLQIKVLKDFGGKVGSIYHKELDYEVLFQPTKGKYEIPKIGEAYEKYDTSGIDEMLPTINPCFYPNSYKEMNDHGDIWAQKWKYEILGDKLFTTVRSDTLKLDLERTISLVDEEIIFDYKLKNLTKQAHFYLWAFHGLLNFDDTTELEFSTDSKILNVRDDMKYNFDYRKLSEYEDKAEYKFYFVDEIENGNVKIYQKSKNALIEMNFDTDINKYLGVWITKGAFKNEYNLAIEPTNGFYDSLDRAFKNNKIAIIESGEEKEWNLKLLVTKGVNYGRITL